MLTVDNVCSTAKNGVVTMFKTQSRPHENVGKGKLLAIL